MKKYLLILGTVIVVLTLINLVILNKYRQTQADGISIMTKYNELSVKELRQSNILKEQSLTQHLVEGYLSPNLKLKSIQSQNDIELHQLIRSQGTSLFFYFRETDCDACIQRTLILLKNVSSHFSNGRVVVLSGYSNTRQFYAFANEQKQTFDIYNIDKFPLLPNLSDLPYLFVITPDMQIRNVFIPLKEDSRFTDEYLKLITEKYWHVHHEGCSH